LLGKRQGVSSAFDLKKGNPVSNAEPKKAVYSNLAEISQAIGHPHRLELLEHLGQGPRTVEALAQACGLSFANTSRHLQILRRVHLVDTERLGKHVQYSIAGHDAVVMLLQALGRVGERNRSEVSQLMTDYFFSRDALAPVSRTELASRLKDGLVTILDVRPEHEYKLGHLPGALNIPLEQLEQHLVDWPKTLEIIAYCRGPYCVMSFEAVAELRKKGFNVRRLEDGFPEWKAAGFAVEMADSQ